MNNIRVDSIIAFSIAVFFQVLFLIVLCRNIVIRKSLVGWLFPGGTTKTERILMAISIIGIVVIIIICPLLLRK